MGPADGLVSGSAQRQGGVTVNGLLTVVICAYRLGAAQRPWLQPALLLRASARNLAVQLTDIDVFCYPSDDLEFEKLARKLARQFPGASMETVEKRLREDYPNARLALRTERPGSIPDEDRVTWYAYRDGNVLPDAQR